MKLYIQTMLDGQGKHLSFHTPGHKRAGEDITELSYSDNLLSPSGVIARAEEDAARILGAARSFFLTDGSTCGVFSMLYALSLAGVKRLAVPEYSHRSVRNACTVLGIEMVVIPQEVRFGIPSQPKAEAAEKALKAADALLVTSPDYYGYLAPMSELKALCATHAKPFVIDGAHGSHLHFSDMYAGNYADLWVDGVHKSLPARTQGAVVSAKTEAWAELLQRGVRTFRTTSPSYPILASVEYAVKYPRNEEIEGLAQDCKRTLGALENDDWSKIVLPFGESAKIAQTTLEKEGIYPEFCDGNYLMFYLSPCTKKGELKRLVRSVKGLARHAVQADVPAGIIPIYSEE